MDKNKKIGKFLLRASSIIIFIFLIFTLLEMFYIHTNIHDPFSYLIDEREISGWTIFYLKLLMVGLLAPICAIIGGNRYLKGINDKRKFFGYILAGIGFLPIPIFLSIHLSEWVRTDLLIEEYTVSSIIFVFYTLQFLPVLSSVEHFIYIGSNKKKINRLLLFTSIWIYMIFILINEDNYFYYYDTNEIVYSLPIILGSVNFFLLFDIIHRQWIGSGTVPRFHDIKERMKKYSKISEELDGNDLDVLLYVKAGLVFSIIGILFILIMLPFLFIDMNIYYPPESLFFIWLPAALSFFISLSAIFIYFQRKKFRANPDKGFKKIIYDGEYIEIPTLKYKRIIWEEKERTEIFSNETYSKWSTRFICIILLMFASFIFPYTLMRSEYFSDWFFYLDYMFFGSWIVLSMLLIPYSVLNYIFDTEKKRDKIYPIIFQYIAFIIITIFITGIIGPYELDDWGEYLRFDVSGLWMLFLFLPFISSLIYPTINKYIDRKRLVSVILSIIIAFTCVILSYSILKDDWYKPHDDNIIEMTSHFIYIGPIILAVIIALLYSGSNYSYIELKSIRPIIKSFVKNFKGIGILLFIIILIPGPILEMESAYRNWHSYTLNVSFPDGIDESYSKSILDQDINDLMNISVYDEYLLDPNVVTMDVIYELSNWVREAEKDKKWGNYYVEIKVDVIRDVDFHFNKTGIHTSDHYRNEGIEIQASFGGLDDQYYLREYYRHFVYFKYNESVCIFNGMNISGPWEDENITVSYDKIDFVMAELDFGQQTAPLAGYGGHLRQYVCVREGEIIYVHSWRDNWIS